MQRMADGNGLILITWLTCLYVYAAMQMWTLARYLPLLIGDLVPEEDKHWETFLTLLDILRICLAPKTNKEQAAHLELLIMAHHESFKEGYPDICLIPKQHYMVHYPEWIRRYVHICNSALQNMHACYNCSRPMYVDVDPSYSCGA